MNETHTRAAESDDLSLIRQAREGSRDAFEKIVQRHQAVVRRTVWRIVGNADDVDDVAQEVFLSLLKSVDGFRAESRFQTWLVAISRNRAISFLRKRQRSEHLASVPLDQWVEQRFADGHWPAGETEPDRQSALRQCLEQLNESHRRLIEAVYFNDMKASELARQNGQKTSAVRTKLMRIRRALARCIERIPRH